MTYKFSLTKTARYLLMYALMTVAIWYGWHEGQQGLKNLVVLLNVLWLLTSFLIFSETYRSKRKKNVDGVPPKLRGWLMFARLVLYAYLGAWVMVGFVFWFAFIWCCEIGIAAQEIEELK